MSPALVSIVIPVYNGSDYLREAIDSALAQTYPNIEVIIVNDGSDDEGRTKEIATSYGSRIRYLEKENGGVASAMNAGIKAANGKYISWLSHDDAYFPNKLEVQVPVLERLASEGRAAICYSSYVQMDERSQVYSTTEMPDLRPSDVFGALLCHLDLSSGFFLKDFYLNGCTLLIPKEAFDRVGYFDISLPTTQDYDLWFKMLGSYDFVKAEGLLVKSRVHAKQGSRVLQKKRIGELEDLYYNAIQLYEPGSSRYDLDLPRAVLGLKMRRRLKAHAVAMEILKSQPLTLRARVYIFRSNINTKTWYRIKLVYRIGMIKIKRAFRSDR